jgi:hypothetical protein
VSFSCSPPVGQSVSQSAHSHAKRTRRHTAECSCSSFLCARVALPIAGVCVAGRAAGAQVDRRVLQGELQRDRWEEDQVLQLKQREQQEQEQEVQPGL